MSLSDFVEPNMKEENKKLFLKALEQSKRDQAKIMEVKWETQKK